MSSHPSPPPLCIFCGKPFREQKLPEHLLQLPGIGEKLRYIPQCDCYRREREAEERKRREEEAHQLREERLAKLFQRSRLAPRLVKRTLEIEKEIKELFRSLSGREMIPPEEVLLGKLLYNLSSEEVIALVEDAYLQSPTEFSQKGLFLIPNWEAYQYG